MTKRLLILAFLAAGTVYAGVDTKRATTPCTDCEERVQPCADCDTPAPCQDCGAEAVPCIDCDTPTACADCADQPAAAGITSLERKKALADWKQIDKGTRKSLIATVKNQIKTGLSQGMSYEESVSNTLSVSDANDTSLSDSELIRILIIVALVLLILILLVALL
ncbi:MAG: hypothetical protein ACK51A_00310 [Sphingobacteriia bacterium]